jgi:hypothetical protein
MAEEVSHPIQDSKSSDIYSDLKLDTHRSFRLAEIQLGSFGTLSC